MFKTTTKYIISQVYAEIHMPGRKRESCDHTSASQVSMARMTVQIYKENLELPSR